ncbi:hypothetical protein BJF93_09300 [Xaviernesmea oryzae]|uniref:Uncharacterized protein n=1 Tax=Xaviernesmea oryzae TaxID=464029 RepID=A0A1Q9AWK5_9HYPH|nr:hypothetical protein [Xaviernesmea oryzae]OLP59804.1 hypothetical protein BJF93_09300 [Xaviernesmea oryzae]SEK51298.1 hypothetical protein SAMN04487976_102356 [Xaviernesmea oryzae]
MTQIVTISASTAAFAAEAVKPKARMAGDQPSDEAITLLQVKPPGKKVQPAIAEASASNTGLSLALMERGWQLQQETYARVLHRYAEMMEDEPGADADAATDDDAAQDESEDDAAA